MDNTNKIINYEDYKNICRMCMLYCCPSFNKDSVILDIFHKLTDIHFETNDELPQQICHKCFDFIHEINAFSIKCRRSHSVLNKCLNDYKNKPTREEQEIVEEQTNIKDEITIEEHKIELVKVELDNDLEMNEEMDIKNETTIEEHKIEFAKDELDNDWKTNDVLNEDTTERTNDLLLPPLLTKIHTENEEDYMIEHPSVSKHSTNVQIHRYKCDQCEKSFRQSNKLIRHKRVHNGEKPYKCDQCGKSFTRLSSLTRHELVHNGARPYKCDQCGKSFTQLGHFNIHKRVHSGERPYQCDQCEKSFTQSSDLLRHKRVHSGEKPFQCDQCGKSFAESGKLKIHKGVHSGERPHQCDQCEKSFTQLGHLNVHKRLH